MQRVAVAIPDRSLRLDLAACVQAAGYAVTLMTSNAELSHASALGADAVLMDASEPAALDAIASLRAQCPAIRIIVIGDDARRRHAIETRLLGADDFVRIPFDVTTLERTLTAAVGREESMSQTSRFITQDPATLQLLDRAAHAADSEATIVIKGESGTGKSSLARSIHQRSRRRHGPLVTVGCAGLSASDGATGLFGHAEEAGRIAEAGGGTVVFDNVGDLALEIQPSLLHLLQSRTLMPPGPSPHGPVDIRIIATTRRDLWDDVRAGRLREDLRLRLAVIELEIPPLRERLGDIDLLASRMAADFAQRQGTPPPHIDAGVLSVLREQPLNGNVRQLQSLMQRAAMLFAGRDVDPAVLLSSRAPEPHVTGMPATLNLKELEREAITRCLIRSGGNRTRASRDLGISVRTLRNKIRQYGLA